MESLFTFTTPPDRCAYLPDQVSRLRYELVASATPAEYMARMAAGWRRFGFAMFRPECRHCTACRSLRVPAAGFRPNRSQRRCRAANDAVVALKVGRPAVTKAKLDLHHRFHVHQTAAVGWPDHGPKDARDYEQSFVQNPFAVEEWCYTIDGRLVGVGYVDVLPAGLSAIYFFHDPDEKARSLGTYNVLRVIEETARRGLPHAYLGYYVDGCRSLAYKANFAPNQVLTPAGDWVDFRKD